MPPPFNIIISHIEHIIKESLPSPFITKGYVNQIEKSRREAIFTLTGIYNYFHKIETGNNMAQLSILAFGSIGRLESSMLLSDVEMMFICLEQSDKKRCKRLLRQWVQDNYILLNISHEDVDLILNNKEVLSFPVLTIPELLSENGAPRRIQIMLESKPLKKYPFFRDVYFKILNQYGFPDNFPSQAFFDDIHSFLRSIRTGYHSDITNSFSTGGKAAHKMIKAIFLRYLFEITLRITLANFLLFRGFGVIARSTDQMHCLLAQDNFTKFLEWINRRGEFNYYLLDSRDLAFKREIKEILKNSIGNFVLDDQAKIKNFLKEFKTNTLSEPVKQLGAILVLIFSDYNKLLTMLHDTAFVNLIRSSANYNVLSEEMQFKQFLALAKHFSDNVCIYIKLLYSISRSIVKRQVGLSHHAIDQSLRLIEELNSYNIYYQLFDVLNNSFQ